MALGKRVYYLAIAWPGPNQGRTQYVVHYSEESVVSAMNMYYTLIEAYIERDFLAAKLTRIKELNAKKDELDDYIKQA